MKSGLISLTIATIFLSCNDDQPSIKAQKDCIERIMSHDDSLGNIRNQYSEEHSLGASIEWYADEMENYDYTDCPEDFTRAFSKHLEAWIDMIEIVEHHDHLRGEMHALFDQISESKDSQEFNRKMNAIWTTWSEVESARNQMKSVK